MIDQNTVVHVGNGKQQSINLGKISLFEYVAEVGNGEIKLAFTRKGAAFDREEVSRLISMSKEELKFTLISNNSERSYDAKLDEVTLKSSEYFDTLILKASIA
ncbi:MULTISPECIES: hypothetical protein [Enterobacteriaceae]|uniref:hypothetical protein n=1 Tax=Enterobacteriaceae TaxID=543 RepID=UPI000B958122|nr:hypothetical protein [Shigella sonnei]EJL9712741.1 hypothetical protein [Escherichia coli]HCM9312631.1 hypothetical protein [Enterobacter kobei]MEB8167969.1 hypothetical protein [Escherichia coli]OYI64065.1 hypothetical protein CI688_00455 [Shigella sonnei]HAW8004678.1 hypothetical protein [Escherichia coli]